MDPGARLPRWNPGSLMAPPREWVSFRLLSASVSSAVQWACLVVLLWGPSELLMTTSLEATVGTRQRAGPGPCAGWEGLRNPPALPPPRQHVAPVSGDSVSRNLEKFNYGQPSWLSPPPPVSEEREARQQGPRHPSPAGPGGDGGRRPAIITFRRGHG